MVNPRRTRTFVPMRNSFVLLYASIGFVLLVFVANGIWFSRQVQGLSQAINLAGSERMRTFQIAFLLARAANETAPAREQVLGHVKMEMDRFEEIMNALKDGSRKYGLRNLTDEESDARLKELILEWEEVFKPQFNAILIAAPEDRKQMVFSFDTRIHSYVENGIDGLVVLLVRKMHQAEMAFVSVRYALILLAVVAMGFNLIYLRRRILHPIGALMRDTEEVTKGNYAVSSDVSTPNEFMLLAERFNAMTAAVASTFGRMEETVRQRTEELSVSNARMQSFFDSAPDAILSIRPEDRSVILFSRGAEKMFGYTAAEVVGNNVSMLMPEPYHSNHDAYVKQYLNTGIKKVIGTVQVVKARKKDGTVIDIDLSVSESVTPGGRVFNAIIRDISARVEAERALAEKNVALESVARYDQAFARITAVFSSTFDQKLALDRILSILAELLPLPCSAFYTYDEWSGNLVCVAANGVSDTLRKEFALGEGIVGQSVTDKRAIVVEETAQFPLTIEAGVFTLVPRAVIVQPVFHQEKFMGVLVVASTAGLGEIDRGFMEKVAVNIGIALQNLRQYSDLKDLSEQIKIRGEEVSRKNLELEQANRLKSEFLANMSHELRTPLNAIIGFSEVLKDGVLGELTPDQADYTRDIFTSGQHLLSLINDILDLSKIDAGKMTLDLEALDVPPLLENSLSVVREKALAHNIKLRLEIEEGVGTITADARKFKQIVYNLLANAVKFTPDGGSVSVVARRAGEFLEISVTDTGIGISEADIARLFKPFEQLDGSLSRKFEGTGLGLAMVRSLAELHGGAVDVRSEPGKGSCFTARIPYRQDAEPAVAPAEVRRENEPVATAVGAFQPLVLIVEDDEQAAELMRVQLESEGYRTLLAPTAETGLALAASRRPDLITLDILLPGMDGWKFLEKIKADEDLAGIPVVIVSIVADLNRGFSLGAANVMQKPVTREGLLSAIREMGLSLTAGGRPLSVLVVDDDPKAVELVSGYFARQGCVVHRAYGGREGIDVALREKPDLMVVDLMMPEVTGFDVVNALKVRPETVAMTIIVLTAKIITAQDQQALSGSVARIVRKGGFKGDDFVMEVRRALSGRGPVRTETGTASGSEGPGAASAGQLPAATRGAAPAGEEPLVLVVEDNQNQSDLLRLYLEGEGYRVLQVANGREALELLSHSRPDLITLDLMMPEMDGFVFLEEKGRKPELAGIPVIIVSATAAGVPVASLGANAFLSKPIRRHEMLAVVETLVGKRRGDRRPKILLVDDDPKAVKIISSYFDAQAFEMLREYGGRQGLETARSRRPDLVVLDLMMPEMNGFEVLDHLRESDATREIPVVILTAKVLTAAERAHLQSRVGAIFEKSGIGKEAFLEQVRAVMAKKPGKGA